MVTLAFILFPIIGLPIYLYYYIFDKNKKGILYSAIIGLILGIFAYYFIPKIDYDLCRHQLIVEELRGLKFSQFLTIYKQYELEFIPSLYSYIISLTNNINLLQFFVVSLGYSIILYMLYDYRKQTNISTLSFIIVSIFILFGFNALHFISGLYYYIAVIIFSLAFYLEYNKGKKILPYILYIMTIFIHNSMLFALAILLIYKVFRNKCNLKSFITCVLIFGLSFYVIEFLVNSLNMEFLRPIQNMYNAYVTKDDSLKKLYSGAILIIEISKLFMTLLCVFLQKEKSIIKGNNGFAILLSISTIIMMLRSRVMIRFVMLIQFIGIVPMMDSLNTKNKKLLIIFLITFLSIIYIAYFYTVFSNQSFGEIKSNMFRNIFDIFRKV